MENDINLENLNQEHYSSSEVHKRLLESGRIHCFERENSSIIW